MRQANNVRFTLFHIFVWAFFVGLPAIVYAHVAGPLQQTSVSETTNDSSALLCRFGVNALEDPALTNLSALRVGWYMNFNALENPPRPNGMEYMPVIRFSPSNNNAGYTYEPNGASLQAVIVGNPGAKWLISNEPDSPFQDNLEPEVYARAYHELYHLIKVADPTAKIVIGSIVQATEIRLLYLDKILVSYYQQYDQPLPTDGWSIHNYILNEVSCDYDPFYCWGADIPPGVDRDYGEIWGIKDNDRVDIFIDRIVRFRQWLADRGYTGQPVYLTEYGVLMPEDFADENGNEFPPSRVNTFMAGTYDYMLSAIDPILGDPNDGFRMVQQWSWFSTTDTNFNGTLFTFNSSSGSFTPTEMGDFFANYTAVIDEVIDFYPLNISATSIPFSQGEAVTVTVRATVANSGNLSNPITATVSFYDAPPQNGGELLGSPQSITLSGCGDNKTLTAIWPNLPPGSHILYVQVTPDESVTDSNLANNIASGRILVATERTYLPTIIRSLPVINP